jgi:hypothetical protein
LKKQKEMQWAAKLVIKKIVWQANTTISFFHRIILSYEVQELLKCKMSAIGGHFVLRKP